MLVSSPHGANYIFRKSLTSIPEQQGDVHAPVTITFSEGKTVGCMEQIGVKHECPVFPVRDSYSVSSLQKSINLLQHLR